MSVAFKKETIRRAYRDAPANALHQETNQEAMMTYYTSKILKIPFEQALERTSEELRREGFGILTEIDVTQTLKTNLDVDFRRYRILGACNPPYAHQALQAEDKIGLMLPCNVVVQEHGENGSEVAAVDPIASMLVIDNDRLRDIARQMRSKLNAAISRL